MTAALGVCRQGGAREDHPCEKMKSEEKLRGSDDYVMEPVAILVLRLRTQLKSKFETSI